MADRDLVIVTSTVAATFESTIMTNCGNGYAVKVSGQYLNGSGVLTYFAHMWKGAGYEVGGY